LLLVFSAPLRLRLRNQLFSWKILKTPIRGLTFFIQSDSLSALTPQLAGGTVTVPLNQSSKILTKIENKPETTIPSPCLQK
jgi:hypothetical protein